MLKKYSIILLCSLLSLDVWGCDVIGQNDDQSSCLLTSRAAGFFESFSNRFSQLGQRAFGEVASDDSARLPSVYARFSRAAKAAFKVVDDRYKPKGCHFTPGSDRTANFPLLEDALSVERKEDKMEKITHTVWLTREKNPVDLPERYRKWLENSVQTNPDFKHWLWTNNRTLLSHDTIKALEDKGVEIKEVKQNLDHCKLRNLYHYEKALQESKFANASDIIRLEILFQHGGFYKDTDYEMLRPFRLLHKLYDSYSCAEPWQTLVGNAAFGAKKYHPMIFDAMERITRNHSNANLPLYLNILKHCNFHFAKQAETIVKTGPGVLTLAAYKHTNIGTNRDIIFPHQYLYPANWERDFRNLGVHYWEGSWAHGKFGNSIGAKDCGHSK